LELDEEAKQQQKAAEKLIHPNKHRIQNFSAEDTKFNSETLAKFAPFAEKRCQYLNDDLYHTFADPEWAQTNMITKQHTETFQDEDNKTIQRAKKVKLWWNDPMYVITAQPDATEQRKLRRMYDTYSDIGTTIVIWGYAENLWTIWAPMFRDKFDLTSPVKYHVDPSLLFWNEKKPMTSLITIMLKFYIV